jgi:mono/diheme cytochrome c family protein
LLADAKHPNYFGRTNLQTMSNWIDLTRGVKSKLEAFDKDCDLIAAWLATHPTAPPKDSDPPGLVKGYQAFAKSTSCIRCHTFAGQGGRTEASRGPDFTGYGNADWLRLMIMAPDHPLRYGRDNRNVMPLFRDLHGSSGDVIKQDLKRTQDFLLKKLEDADPKDPATKEQSEKILQSSAVSHLSDVERELIIRFLVGDDRVVFFGRPVSGPPHGK